MGNFIANISKGAWADKLRRINANDPANAVLVVGLVLASGVESDATLLDKDSISDLFSGATNEATDASYARKVLDQAGGITIVVDDTNDRVDGSFPDQTFAGLAGGAISDVFTGYDSDSTGGNDTNIEFVSFHDWAVTPDGSDATVDVPTAGFARAA